MERRTQPDIGGLRFIKKLNGQKDRDSPYDHNIINNHDIDKDQLGKFGTHTGKVNNHGGYRKKDIHIAYILSCLVKITAGKKLCAEITPGKQTGQPYRETKFISERIVGQQMKREKLQNIAK